MKYVVRTDAEEQLWRPLPETHPESGYLLYQMETDCRWTWLYMEPGEDDEFGPTFAHRDEALSDIADNWEECGGTKTPRFLSTVRGQANRARYERRIDALV